MISGGSYRGFNKGERQKSQLPVTCRMATADSIHTTIRFGVFDEFNVTDSIVAVDLSIVVARTIMNLNRIHRRRRVFWPSIRTTWLRRLQPLGPTQIDRLTWFLGHASRALDESKLVSRWKGKFLLSSPRIKIIRMFLVCRKI